MMQDYRGPERDVRGMQPKFALSLTLGVIAALTAATAILYSLVILSIQPASLSAEMPRVYITRSK